MIPLFVGTWIMAPRETLSGTIDSPQIDLPYREPAGAPPIMQLVPLEIRRTMPTRTIFGLERTWKVALTFDDGPHLANTRRLLRILDQHDAKATFFVNGYWLDEHRRSSAKRLQQLLIQAHEAGHTIGNHTYGHRLLSHLSPQEQREEIVRNHETITRVIGRPPTLFRPPYAVLPAASRKVIAQLGYTNAMWSATAPDQEITDPVELSHTVMGWLLAYNGGIVMLHDRHRWSVDATALLLQSIDRYNCRRLARHRPTLQVVSLDSFLRPPTQSWALRVEVEQQRHLQRLRRVCSIR